MKLLKILFAIGCYSAAFGHSSISFGGRPSLVDGLTPALNDTPLVVKKCVDFAVNGTGDNREWQKTGWVRLNQIEKSTKQLESKIKILYSSTGIYVLFNGEDQKITSTYNNDFEKLYNGDVFEVFFHPIPTEPLYFEYEISPLSKELVLLISNHNGKLGQGVPWGYEEIKVVKKVTLIGGSAKHNSAIQGWTAELFFPNALLNFFGNVPPGSGTRWNANFCRLDYDSGQMVKWSWSPIKVRFHEFEKYFALQFE